MISNAGIVHASIDKPRSVSGHSDLPGTGSGSPRQRNNSSYPRKRASDKHTDVGMLDPARAERRAGPYQSPSFSEQATVRRAQVLLRHAVAARSSSRSRRATRAMSYTWPPKRFWLDTRGRDGPGAQARADAATKSVANGCRGLKAFPVPLPSPGLTATRAQLRTPIGGTGNVLARTHELT